MQPFLLSGAREIDESQAQPNLQSFLRVPLPIWLHFVDHLVQRKPFFFFSFFAFDTESNQEDNCSLEGAAAIEQSQPLQTSAAPYSSKESYNSFLATWAMIYLIGTWKKSSLICLVVILIFLCVGVGWFGFLFSLFFFFSPPVPDQNMSYLRLKGAFPFRRREEKLCIL